MDPPDQRAVVNALDLLKELGALELQLATMQQQPQLEQQSHQQSQQQQEQAVHEEGQRHWALTSLGHVLAELPLNPRLGKMLVLGAVYGWVGGSGCRCCTVGQAVTMPARPEQIHPRQCIARLLSTLPLGQECPSTSRTCWVVSCPSWHSLNVLFLRPHA